MKIVYQNEVLTSEALNAEMILNENIRKANEDARAVWTKEFDNTKPYKKYNKTGCNGSSYICLQDCVDKYPPDYPLYWQLFASAGAGLTDASQLPITDIGDYYTSSNTGDALQEIGIKELETTGSGVLYNSGLEVTTQSTPDMTVSVSTGTTYSTDGKRYTPTANTSLAITTADTTNPRIDIVYVNSSGVISYLAGTASATPTAPSLPSGGILLAEISVIANATSISSTDIIDKRTIVKSNVELLNDIEEIGSNISGSITFDSVALMKADTTLAIGDYVTTTGYYSVNDGGGANYIIVASGTGTDDGGSYITLDNTLQALLLIKDNIVNVKQFGAKGDGTTDDSTFINSAFAYASSFSGNTVCVLFANGIFTIADDINIPNGFGKSTCINKIIGIGATIKSTSSNVSYVFNFQNYITTENIYIDGLIIDGNYLSGGINLYGVNVFDIGKCKVKHCTIGLVMADSYYGEIGNETTFIENLIAIKFTTGTAVENNTIRLGNIRISGVSDSSLFGTSGMSRIGILLNSMLGAVKFDGVIIEAVDYGILGFDMTSYSTTNGGVSGIFTIKECYFEAISQKAIALGVVTFTDGVATIIKNTSTAGQYNVMPNVSILGCRFATNGNSVQVSAGKFYIRNNQGFYLNVLTATAYPTYLDSDLSKSYMTFDSTSMLNVITNKDLSTITISNEYLKYGESTASRLQSVGYYKTHENRNTYIQSDPIIYNKCGVYANINNVTTNNVAFIQQEKRLNGTILMTPSGSYAMVTVKDDFSLVAKQIFNAGLVTKVYNTYLPHEAYKTQSTLTIGSTVDIMGTSSTFGTLETFTVSSSNELTTTATGFTGNMVRIGTAKRILQQTIPSSNNTITFYDPAIDKYYISYNGTLCYAGDYLGINTTTANLHILAAGVLSSRPTTPSVESTYFATDNNTYYIYQNSAWTTLTPLFTIS